MKHPAKELGAWLKMRRQQQGMVLRVFAGQIELSPAEYAEAEAGVVRWLGPEQETHIPQVLGLSAPERRQFLALLDKARTAERWSSRRSSPANNLNRSASATTGTASSMPFSRRSSDSRLNEFPVEDAGFYD